MNAQRRLFAGIALDEEQRRAGAAAGLALQRTGFSAKYEDACKLHLTLAFLGNVPEARCEEMMTSLRDAVTGIAPFEIVLDKLGAFPHERKPRIVYLGARTQGAAFRSLAQAVRGAYAACGFTFDGDPVAHATLARVKHPTRALPLVDFTPIAMLVREVCLFESIFDKAANTSRYETLTTVILSGGSHLPMSS